MFEEYASAVNVLGLEQVIERDDTAKIPENINLMRYCVDMYDQEFMVKHLKYKKINRLAQITRLTTVTMVMASGVETRLLYLGGQSQYLHTSASLLSIKSRKPFECMASIAYLPHN
ncbi:hypothetical protein CU097_004593 [Rhizopus azygosporus]|uniref:Uncharacterized protein n=1 Tax=Rhizopus azygosporus TaxID=86630 RepID=A0A367J4S1_RHIAZ|nr:hypothetical protein CU097_004593 [Rhizopus azygosporus]